MLFLGTHAFWCVKFAGLPELVLSNVRRPDAWETNAFNTVIFLMVTSLMVHGICRSHCMWGGKDGTVNLTADTTVCLPGSKKERNLVLSLPSITGNGHSVEFMEFRFLTDVNCCYFHDWAICVALFILGMVLYLCRNLFQLLSLSLILVYNFMAGYHFLSL